jgi:hypothetical protein
LKDLGRLTYRRFLELFRHMVGLLGRVISPSQGLYLHTTTQHRKTQTNIHALSGIWTHDPSNQPTGQDPRPRPHGHRDRHNIKLLFCGSTVIIRTRASSHMRILELFRHMVGLTGRVISPSQGLYLHRTTQHRKTGTNIHALSGIRTHASDRTATVTGGIILNRQY